MRRIQLQKKASAQTLKTYAQTLHLLLVIHPELCPPPNFLFRIKKPPADFYCKSCYLQKAEQHWNVFSFSFFPPISIKPGCLLISSRLHPNLWSLKCSHGSSSCLNFSPGPPLGSAKLGKLGKCEKSRKEKHQAAVSCQENQWYNFIWKWECCRPRKKM